MNRIPNVNNYKKSGLNSTNKKVSRRPQNSKIAFNMDLTLYIHKKTAFEYKIAKSVKNVQKYN